MITSTSDRPVAKSWRVLAGYTPQDLLTTLSSPGQTLMIEGGKQELWDHGSEVDPDATSFWLPALNPPPKPRPKRSRRPESQHQYLDWTHVVTGIPMRHWEKLKEAILSGQLNVTALFESSGGVFAVFRVDAATKSEWTLKCREVEKAILKLGIKALPSSWGALLPLKNPQTGEGSVIYMA